MIFLKYLLMLSYFVVCCSANAATLLVGDFENGVIRVDTATASIIDNILNVPNKNYHVGFSSPDQNYIYVAPFGTELRRFDTASGNAFDVLATGNFSHFTVGKNGTIFAARDIALGEIYSYSPTTGATLVAFEKVPQMTHIKSMAIGPDGLLYVGSDALDQGISTANIVRFNPATGAYVDEFVPTGLGNLNGTTGIAFGPDGDLYVANARTVTNTGGRDILRFDGETGAYLGIFVTPPDDVDSGPITDITISESGDLYVGMRNHVLRYNLTTGYDQTILGIGEVSRPLYLSLSDELLFMPQTLAVAVVPEPATAFLLLAGLLLSRLHRRRC